MKLCPCKDCISYAICNSKFKDAKYVVYEVEYIARSLIDKCSIIRNYLTKFNKISVSSYSFDIIVTVNIRLFINTFIDESLLSSQSSSSLLTLKLVYDNNDVYKRVIINIP